MIRQPRITSETLRVLEAIISQGEASGAEVAKATSLATGTLYPILQRLERAGWLTSEWECEDPRILGRPRRRFYKITGVGLSRAHAAASSIQVVVGRLVAQ